MTTDIKHGLPETLKLPHEAQSHNITPFFKHMSLLNVAQSEDKGKPVYDLKEVVELRFAGDRNYAPVFPADAMSTKVGNRVITFAERWSDQYRDFVSGGDQRSSGTALEMLMDYGVTPAQLSICRALKVYSIEALHGLDGPNLKNLGMNANELKSMARRYMEERARKSPAATAESVDDLRAEIDRLRAQIPVKEASRAEIDALVAKADDEFEALDDAELKALIKDRTGQAPRGTPSRSFLLNAVRELS